ncbi:MAG: glucose-1-phosphate thymidylyltransferase, partial [Bacteroidales bacterium]|nr:glucose-1-phosphate thymidylyltransferase [Bacteroidales bacterium]
MISYLLCDDPDIRQQLLPFTFTRPVARLRVGIDTLEEKWRDFLG